MGIKLPKIDLNPFDDPGGPLEIDLGDIDLLDWEIDLNPFDAGELLEVDLVDSVENIVTAIEEDPIGTLGTIAMTMAGMPPWAISLVQGANTVAQGGSIEDAVKGMVLTYAGAQLGDIAGNQANKALQQLTNQAGGNLVNPAVANAIGAGSKNAAISLVHGKSPQEIANSFLMGNVSAGVGSVLGKIDDSLGLDGTAFEDLSSGVQDAITAGVTAAIEGGDVTAEAITGLVKGYGQAVIPVAEKLQTSMGLNERQATLITDALGRSMQSAFEGGDPTDAFFESFRVNAEKEMKDWVNSPEGLNINRKLDDLFNNTPELEEKAETMNEAGGAYVKASEDYEAAIDNYNRAVTGNNFIANEEKRLLDEYNRLKGIYNDTNDETTYNAAITAQNNLNTYIAENKDQAAQYQADIATYKPIYDAAKTAYESTQTTYTEAKSEYDKATNFVLSDIDDLGDGFKPIISAADMAVATAIRPTFDPEEYKRVLQLGADENAATHYLSNQADGDAIIAQYTVQELGATLADLKSEDSGYADYIATKDPKVFRSTISKLNAAGELEEIPSLYTEVETLDELFKDFTSQKAKDMVASLNLGNIKKLNSSIDDIVSLSPQDAEKINQIVDNVEEGKTFAEDLADGFKVMFGNDTFAYNSMLKMYSAIGDTIAGTAEAGGYIADKFVDAYNNDSQEGNNYWLQGLGLTDEDVIEMDPSTYGSDMVGDFVTFTQEQQEILLDQMGPRGKQFLEGSQYGGDVTLPTVVFKDVYGVMVPVGFEGDFSVENFTLGKNPTIYGYGLHAAEGLGDIALNVGLAFFGTKGLALGGAIDVAEAVGMSAIAIEEAVLKELENPEYIAGAEYQDTLNNRAGGDRQKANALLLQDAKAYALYAGVADGVADATMAKIIVKPMSVFGSKAINAGTNATAASAAEVAGEVGQEFLNNMGLTSIDALNVELGDNLAGAAIGALAEGSTGSGVALLNSLVTDIRKDSADNGTVPPSGGKTSTNSNSAAATALAGALSVISPELHAAESDPTNVLNAAITKDVMLNSIYSLEGLDKLDTPITNAASLVSVLSTNGISDPETIAEIGNVVYNNDFVTKTEISNTLKTINPAFNPTEELSAQAYEQFGGNKSQKELDKSLETFIDPYYFDRDEVKAAAAAAGVTLTDEQIDDYEGQKDEEAAAEEAAEAFDSMYLDIGEVKAAAEAEGITLTDEQAEAYVGQKDEATAITAIREEYDPQATTYEEAKEFFTGLGFTPTRDQVLQFVDATSEEEQQAAVAEFVDPLYTDAEEARGFLETLGYTPTDAEVQRFTGQIRETQQEEAVGEYVDPRFVDADEVKAAYEALGLARPTDNDIQELVGQYMESGLAGKAEEYLPTARYNSIINILDNFTGEVGVSDEMQGALNIVKKDMIDALGDLGLEVAAIDQTVDNLTEAVGAVASGDAEATGLYGYIDTAIQELKEAGLTNEEVEATIGSVVGSPATVDAGGNEVAATGIYATIADIGETVDNLNDLSTDDVENIVTEAIGELENISAEDVGTIVDEIVGAPATDDAEATGLYATIGDLNNISTEDVTSIVTEAIGELENISAEDVENVVNGIVGAPATEDTDATGIYAAIDNNTNEILDILGNPATDDAEATGIYGYIDSAVDSLGTDLSTLAGNVGTPAEYDEDGNITVEATGIYAQLDDLMSQGMTNAEAIATLAADFGVAVTDLTNLFNETTGEISEDISVVAGDVGDIAGLLGEPAATDNPLTEEDESRDPTGLFGIIAGYEIAGQERDEAIKSAIGDLATQLGTTEQNILDQMGLDYSALTDAIVTSEAGLTEKISDVETSLTELINKNDGDVDAALAELSTALGTTETNILAELGTTKDELTESFTTAISDVEASLGNELDTIAKYVGKPARDVTQTDIDFVIDLIAQENVSQELITQYDVTGDGIVDINDQTLLETALQGEEDVTLADTSMFTPATGLYQQQQQDTQTTQDLITQLNTQLNTKIDDQTEQQNVNNLMQLLGQAEDIGGQRVTVTTPDPVGNITPYDFKSIFRDSAQASRYVSPFGGNQANVAQQALNPMSGFGSFAQGGQVEDENDMLLKMLGELK